MLLEISDNHSKFFRDQVAPICHLMLNIAGSKALEESTRSLALELIIRISSHSAGTVRKTGAVPSVVSLCLSLISEVVSNEEWAKEVCKNPHEPTF